MTQYYHNYQEHKDLLVKDLKTLYTLEQDKGYYPLPCSFDIETTNIEETKNAYMYIWQFSIGNRLLVYGRTWEEFLEYMQLVREVLCINERHRLYIGVHNLSFEFQFIRKWFTWSKVFSVDERKPIYAVTEEGLEFQCTYLMSGKKLANLGTETNKLTYDYDKYRNSKTLLTEDELNYCMSDIIIVVEYLYQQLETYKSFKKIPRTITGVVRNYIKDELKQVPTANIKRTLPRDKKELTLWQLAFQGGFTHSNTYCTGDILEVVGYDLTSAYPSAMVSNYYVVGKPKIVEQPTYNDIINDKYITVFPVTFYNLVNTFRWDSYLSQHKCYNTKNVKTVNGRVFSADTLTTVCTNIDYQIIEKVYKWDSVVVPYVYQYRKALLPTAYYKAIDYFYRVKTEYKGIKEKEEEYFRCKGMLNSLYGMCVTNEYKPTITYNGEWGTEENDIDTIISKKLRQKTPYTAYQYGVLTTAYVRKIIWDFILTAKIDYVYTDTDSIKLTNGYKYLDYVKNYNEDIQRRIQENYKRKGIPYKVYTTQQGIPKPMGVWDFEFTGKFKTLGAKRYLIQYTNGGWEVAVAGCPKKNILDKLGEDKFTNFVNGLYLDPTESGKLCHYYNDAPTEETIDGVVMRERSSVCLLPTDFTMEVNSIFWYMIQFLRGVNDNSIWRQK